MGTNCAPLVANLFLFSYERDFMISKVRKRANIRNRYNQAPHQTQDTNGKVTNSQLDITNESQEVGPFPSGDHKASINRRTRKHNKNKTEITCLLSDGKQAGIIDPFNSRFRYLDTILNINHVF